jgi:SAM-dependent methyltransferase
MTPPDEPTITDHYQALARTLPWSERAQGLILCRARRALLDILRQRGARTVLDLCCGSGCLTCRLTRAGFVAHGFDASASALDRARHHRRGATFTLGDAGSIEYRHEFDAGVISLALHEMDEATRTRTWAALRAAVRPGGTLLALDFAVAGTGPWARWVGRRIDRDEQYMGSLHAPHYHNYRQFMQAGGLVGWLASREDRCLVQHGFLGGNLALLAYRA